MAQRLAQLEKTLAEERAARKDVGAPAVVDAESAPAAAADKVDDEDDDADAPAAAPSAKTLEDIETFIKDDYEPGTDEAAHFDARKLVPAYWMEVAALLLDEEETEWALWACVKRGRCCCCCCCCYSYSLRLLLLTHSPHPTSPQVQDRRRPQARLGAVLLPRRPGLRRPRRRR